MGETLAGQPRQTLLERYLSEMYLRRDIFSYRNAPLRPTGYLDIQQGGVCVCGGGVIYPTQQGKWFIKYHYGNINDPNGYFNGFCMAFNLKSVT